TQFNQNVNENQNQNRDVKIHSKILITQREQRRQSDRGPGVRRPRYSGALGMANHEGAGDGLRATAFDLPRILPAFFRLKK
ncbi:MAG: hypothetical protein ACI9XB_003038, partial [Gammaproteobacteria bacterium]